MTGAFCGSAGLNKTMAIEEIIQYIHVCAIYKAEFVYQQTLEGQHHIQTYDAMVR